MLYVESRVDIPIMQSATHATAPLSHVQVTQSAWSRLGETGRASHRGPGFIDIAVFDTKPHGFIRKHRAKLAPSGIKHGLRHTGFGKFGGRNIAHGNQTGTAHKSCRGFVCPILPAVGDLGMDGGNTPFLVGTLCRRQGVFMDFRQVLSGVFDTIRAGNLVLQSEVNPDLGSPQRCAWIVNLTLQVHVPVSLGILSKASRFDSPLDRSRQPEAEASPLVRDRVTLDTDTASFKRNPPQRAFLTAPLQANLFAVFPLADVFLADFAEGIGMQAQVMASTSREIDQLEGRDEALLTPPDQHSGFITEVEHVVDCMSQTQEMRACSTVFDPVAKREYRHMQRLGSRQLNSAQEYSKFQVERLENSCCYPQQRAFLPPLKRGVSCPTF